MLKLRFLASSFIRLMWSNWIQFRFKPLISVIHNFRLLHFLCQDSNLDTTEVMDDIMLIRGNFSEVYVSRLVFKHMNKDSFAPWFLIYETTCFKRNPGIHIKFLRWLDIWIVSLLLWKLRNIFITFC
jgi:hypothetical protein